MSGPEPALLPYQPVMEVIDDASHLFSRLDVVVDVEIVMAVIALIMAHRPENVEKRNC